MTGTVTASQRLSDAEVAHHLERLFADILAVQEQLDADALFLPVQPGSVLEDDDTKADPYQVSHGVQQGVSVAIDHLHALAVLVGQQRILHASPPFSLMRCSIESAATAYWLLAHPAQPDRLARRFRHAAQDARDADEAAKDMGLQPPKPLPKRLADIQAQANTVVGRPTSLKPLKYVDILGSVDAAVGGSRFRATWRTCSGFAHARLWASLAVLHRDVSPPDSSGVVAVRFTNTPDRVLWAAIAAYELVQHTLALYRERATGD